MKKLIKTDGRGSAQELGKLEIYTEQRAEIEENVKFMKQQWETQDKRK
jgi:hypothetical protein